MKKRISLSVLILALLVAAIVPASAQSSVDPTLLSFVQAAFNNTLAVNSLSVAVNSSTDTSGTGNGGGFGGFGVNRTASYQLASNASDDWNVSGTTSSTTSGGPAATAEANSTPTDNTTTEEIRIVDGKTYIRFTAIPPRMQQQNPPTDWVDVATLPQPAQGTFGGNFATSAPTANQILAELSLPVDATSVTGITEQAADTISGAPMRVFQITLDVDALLKSDSAAALLGGFGRGGFGGGRGGFGGRPGGNGGNGAAATPPANAPAAETATVEAPSSANTQVTLTVWVGADNFVYRIASVVARTGMGQDGQGSTTLNTTTDFANFNQPMTITAPTAGS